MTTAEMLSRVRILLEEATASFWSDNEIYSALTDGQNEAIRLKYSIYKSKVKVNPRESIPEVLRPLIKDETGTIGLSENTLTIPSDLMFLISVRYDPAGSNLRPCYQRGMSMLSYFDSDNQYLKDSTAFKSYFFHLDKSEIVFETTVTASPGSYGWTYLKKPADIASGVDPTIKSEYHDAVVMFAYAKMLLKDQRVDEANAAYNKFIQGII